MTKLPPRSRWAETSLVFGANASFTNACQAWRSNHGRAAARFFPPEVVVQVKAIVCELPSALGLPLSRLSAADIVREVQRCGIVATISDKTVWRWLNEDAIRPWQHRCWIFPRDPDFATKAARIEHEYARGGTWAYLPALDVHRAKVFGRCEQSTGIDPFNRLVAQVMNEPPYCYARRVFWIVDNGSSHRGQASIERLQAAYPQIVPVHGPVHASWLNQIEIYFSIVQRKVLTPNDFSSLQEVQDRLFRFQAYYETIATPFEWKFSRADLYEMMNKMKPAAIPLSAAA